MKKIVVLAATLAAVVTVNAQASIAVAYGQNKVLGEGASYSKGESVSVLYNQPLRPGSFLNLSLSTHQVLNKDVTYPVGVVGTDYNTSGDVYVSWMQGVHDNVYLEAGIGTLFNQKEIKPLLAVGGGVLILDTRTAKISVDVKAMLSNADYVKGYAAGKPDAMYLGQIRLFMPLDMEAEPMYLIDRIKRSSGRLKVNKSIVKGNSKECYSF